MSSHDGMEHAADLVSRALARGADEAQVMHTASTRFELDAGTREVKLVRTTANRKSDITVFRDGCKGTASVNGLDPQALEHGLDDAVEAASKGPADPANGVATDVDTVDTTYGPARPDREAMRDSLEAHLQFATGRYPELLTHHAIYGFNDTQRCFANSAGAAQRERRGTHDFFTMFAAKRGDEVTSFNHSGASIFEPFRRLADAGTVQRTMADVCSSFGPRPVPEKFEGEVIITPQCLSSLLMFIARSLGGYALLAGTSPFAGRLGETIAAANITLSNDPRAPHFAGAVDFDSFGVPTRTVTLIRDGRLENFLVDFFCSRKLGREHTGGQVNLTLAPGESSLDDLIASTRRGILFDRFAGGYPSDNLDFSGVAKSSFYIEDGEVRYPLIETMVSGNLGSLLTSVRGLSRETVNSGDWCYPYMAAGGVTISSR